MNLLGFVSDIGRGHVLAHKVQLIGQTVGPGDVNGGAVVVALPHYTEQREQRIALEKNRIDLYCMFLIEKLESSL